MLKLYFYVEEPSAEAALMELVPRILGENDYDYDIISFEGKQALLKRLPARLKAYQHRDWEDWRVIVLIDEDRQDCRALKQQLEQAAADAGLPTKTISPANYRIINRIAVEELEAWFFGDIEAIRAAYPKVSANLGSQVGYRDPDAIGGGTAEALERLLETYHPGGLEKVRAAQEISKHMDPSRNHSKSFQIFRDSLLGLFA